MLNEGDWFWFLVAYFSSSLRAIQIMPDTIEQACQTGGPIACLMQAAVTYLSHTIT